MDRTERFYKIDQLLQSGKPTPFVKLQGALGISKATLKRDLEYMRSRLNAPIEWDREARGYRFVERKHGPRYELPGIWFSPQEIHALLTMQHLLHNLQPSLLEGHVKPLLARLRAVLGSGDHSWEEIEKRVRILQPGRREASAEYFGVISAALLKRLRLTVRHYNRIEDRETEREVSPQRLIHYRDNWYLDAYCHLRKGLRSFAVDAMRGAQLLETRARELSKSELDEYLKSGYGIFAGREVEWATLKFTPLSARWVSRQSWHSKQRVRVDADGSLIIEIPYADDRELLMEVMRYGDEVEVLGPAALRGRVVDTLRKALKRYR